MLHVGQGTTIGALTVFPVWNGRAGVRHYVTDAAALEVAEVEGGAVPQLGAVNRGSKDVLVLDGQLFEGGWQHRMAARSTVVGAGERSTVDVVCVEQGRWGGAREQVTRGRRASTYVRGGLAAHGADDAQSEVWRRVGRDAVGLPTGSFVDHLDRAGDRLQRRVARLRPLPGQTGVLVGVAGHPLLLEDFDHPRTLAEQYDAILRAAVLDCAGRPAEPTPGRRARRVVERLSRVRPEGPLDADGRSRLLRARTDRLDVAVLERDGRRVHLRVVSPHHPVVVGA